MASELWRPTLPAWRRAAERAQIQLLIRGDLPPDPPSWITAAAEDAPDATILVIDESQLVITAGEAEAIAGLWTSHPLVVLLARRALQTVS